MSSALKTYLGAIHVHTDKSRDEGSIDAIVATAKATGIDFLVLTDHGTRGYAHDSREGWHDGVLVLCGEEVLTPEGHLLALETREDIGPVGSLQEGLDRIHAQGGIAATLHHQVRSLQQPGCKIAVPPIDVGEVIELWSFMDDVLSQADHHSMPQILNRPDKLVTGPSRKLLWKWDRELAKRRLPMIGGLNAHSKKQPLLEWKNLFPYEIAFQSMCTCIQIPELPKVPLRARDLVWNALREGRSYVVNRSVAQETGFSFEYHESNGRVRQMGDDAEYDPKGHFRVQTPQEAEVILRHNGQPYFWGTSKDMLFPPCSTGAYRVEVMLNRKLWILSNPIRLLDDGGHQTPTVSDVT